MLWMVADLYTVGAGLCHRDQKQLLCLSDASLCLAASTLHQGASAALAPAAHGWTGFQLRDAQMRRLWSIVFGMKG